MEKRLIEPRLYPPQFNNYPSYAFMEGRRDGIDFSQEVGAECVMFVHLPFCLQRCSYCTLSEIIHNPDELSPVITSMKKEIDIYAGMMGNRKVKAALLGGGTPSNLRVEQIKDLYGHLCEKINFASDAEVTVEVRPETLSVEKLIAFRACGVNRLSFGVQSLNPEELKLCGRKNTADVLKDCINMAHEAGLDNINFDIILGLPTQTLDTFKQTCTTIFTDLMPNHVSLYLLIVHPKTGFDMLFGKQSELFPQEDQNSKGYDLFFDCALEHGYVITSAENVARTDDLCSHYQRLNWQGFERLAIGPEAIGFMGKTQYVNLGWKNGYADVVNKGELPLNRSLKISGEQELRRKIILGLHNLFISIKDINNEFGVDIEESFEDQWNELQRRKMIVRGDGQITLTAEGRKYLYFLQTKFYEDGMFELQRGRAGAIRETKTY